MTADTHQDYQRLEALIFDPDLEHLEALLSEFNIFEAIGAVRRELRHSDFLAFLLNPNENHGLGDTFLKHLLRHTLLEVPDSPLNAIELDLIDMDQAIVLREWQHIDILIDDSERNQLVCLIENKIDSSEHTGQLKRYLGTIQRKHPTAKIIPIYLTPEGDAASEEAFLSLSYDTVAHVLNTLLQTQASTMGPDVRTLVTHYATMLRRHIVSESEIADLCRHLYRRHQRALDLLFEYRPDIQADLSSELQNIVADTPGLVLDTCSKTRVRFFPEIWDQKLSLGLGQGWTRSGRMLLFEFVNSPDRLKLYLWSGPGPIEIRQRLADIANENPKLFPHHSKTMGTKWTSLYRKDILRPQHYEDASLDDLITIVKKEWQQFCEHDLPQLQALIMDTELPDSAAFSPDAE